MTAVLKNHRLVRRFPGFVHLSFQGDQREDEECGSLVDNGFSSEWNAEILAATSNRTTFVSIRRPGSYFV